MKPAFVVGGVSALVFSVGVARAGGLLLPGMGAVGTARAGADVASAWGPDALGTNPAGIASGTGTVVSVSASLIDYSLSFRRAGNYDDYFLDTNGDMVDDYNPGWEGSPFPEVHDTSKPPIGLGPFQAIPEIAISSDLGGKIPGLYVAFGLFAPNAYPTRKIRDDYQLDSLTDPPPPSRYDVVSQEASVLLPSIAVAYRIIPKLDVGLRFAWGISNVKAKVFLWGQPQNFQEYTGNESIFEFKGHDNFVPNFALGVRYRPTPMIEVGGVWSSQLDVHARGIGIATPSSNLNVGGVPVVITPIDDSIAECAKGGVMGKLKACVNFALPMLAKVGGRWIFRDGDGVERGDVEADIEWEHWGADRASNYEIVVDGQALGLQLKHSFIRHGLRDSYSFRVGGGYGFAVGPGELIARGGVAYDTAAAKSGWERLDIDGAARTMLTAGAGYKLKRWEIDVGGGVVLEGTRKVGNVEDPCNPTIANKGCAGTGMEQPIPDRTGPDPVNPSVELRNQNENPENIGTYKSHYVLFTLGVSTWF